MTLRLFGLLGLAAVAAVACKKDPTDSLRGGPALVLASPNPIFVDPGKTGSVLASLYDAQLNPLSAEFTATSSAPAQVSVTPDNSSPDPRGTSQRFTVAAQPGVTGVEVIVTISAAGISTKDTVRVN